METIWVVFKNTGGWMKYLLDGDDFDEATPDLGEGLIAAPPEQLFMCACSVGPRAKEVLERKAREHKVSFLS